MNLETKIGSKVLLVYPNPAMDNLPSVGVSLLSAYLKNAGHKVKLFDTTFYDDGTGIGELFRERNLQVIKTDFESAGITRTKRNVVDDFRKIVEDYNPDLIGLSSMEISYPQGLKLLKSIAHTKIPKIAGGIQVINYPNEVIKEDCIDMICIGEGEETIVELADRIRDKKDYTDVKNLWVKQNGTITKNPLRPLIDLDDLPKQDWEIYDEKRFFKPYLGRIAITGGMETMRGCIGKCSFCCNPILKETYKGNGKYLRFKSPEKVREEVEYLKEKFKLEFMKFIDPDLFTRSENEFEKLAEIYKSINLPFWAEGRADKVTKKKVRLLEEMGCKGFAIGIESGNEYINNKILKKGTTNKQIIEAVNCFKDSKIQLCANNIIGIPYEGRKEIFDTIELNRILNQYRNVKSSINLFAPYGGTSIRELCVDEGYIDKETLAGDYRCESVLNMPQISTKELMGLYKTFPMYVKFPKNRWSEIRKAEQDVVIFDKLSEEYSKKYLKGGKQNGKNKSMF